MTIRHMIELGCLIFVSWAVGWSYGMQRGWVDGYRAGKDVSGQMLENQDRMVAGLYPIDGGKK